MHRRMNLFAFSTYLILGPGHPAPIRRNSALGGGNLASSSESEHGMLSRDCRRQDDGQLQSQILQTN
jgi:hypothetical protein